jgi:hypothetical protein
VELAVVDGDHSEASTLWAHHEFFRYAADNGVIFFDDIRWSAGMHRAWERIIGSSSGIGAAFDFGDIGIVLISKDHVGRPRILTRKMLTGR